MRRLLSILRVEPREDDEGGPPPMPGLGQLDVLRVQGDHFLETEIVFPCRARRAVITENAAGVEGGVMRRPYVAVTAVL
ncbi:hypothetical protein ABZW11_24575 [Nonomuraea sp. NPDC004580]|uniref:hypothetical protein n=1 Tax=Nonomuraea sp. NPDC004580 TaxID=3154552 RepID=UPI0033AFD63F